MKFILMRPGEKCALKAFAKMLIALYITDVSVWGVYLTGHV